MRPRLGRDESGQLMMLAGVVLTISFILTALTLAQVSALERQAASDAPTPMVAEWRFLHERLKSNIDTGVSADTSTGSFFSTVLPTVLSTFRTVEAEKGYDLLLRPAAGSDYAYPGNEASLLSSGRYVATTRDGVPMSHPTLAPQGFPDDGADDGLVWWEDCDLARTDAPAAGCIMGVYLFVRLSDGATTMEESILFATNR